MMRTTLVLFASLFFAAPSAFAWVSSIGSSTSLRQQQCRSRGGPLYFENDRESLSHTSSPLNDNDWAILSDLRSRHEILPILMIESAVLPGQRIEYASADPKFIEMMEFINERGGGEVGMIGLNPYTSRPLSMGVTFLLKPNQMDYTQDGELVIAIQGHRRFEILGDVWEADQDGFHFADVEMLENKFEPISEYHYNQALYLSNELVDLVDQWVALLLETGRADAKQVRRVLNDIGPMPDAFDKRAIWVAALINPTCKLEVCPEIRPSMLACKTDSDRLQLAYAAITTSIDHLMGKEIMF